MQMHSNLWLNNIISIDRWQAFFERISFDGWKLYNGHARHLLANTLREEVIAMTVREFAQAVVAGMIGHYACNIIDDVVKLIIDWLK